MPCDTRKSALVYRIETAECRLYTVQHVAQFISDVAAACKPGTQSNHVLSESIAVTLSHLASEISAVRDVLSDVTEDIYRGGAGA